MFHFFAGSAIVFGLIGSIVNLFHSNAETHYSAALITLIFIVLVFLFWYTRSFALRAQDRAIRAEENFRHFILTGKPLDKQLRLSQIIALRFAADEEFPELAKRAVSEKLSQKEIKLAITNWRADYNRV
jgi:Na+/melibiose symporter-like transporter